MPAAAPPKPPGGRRRPTTLALWRILPQRSEFTAPYPGFTPAPRIAHLPIVPLNDVAIGAMFAWKRRGVWLAFVNGFLAIPLELYGFGPELHVWRVPVVMILLALAVRPAWKRFRSPPNAALTTRIAARRAADRRTSSR
jgi:hypothetical protein